MTRMQYLVEVLAEASNAYYYDDCPIMSDAQYDRMYDELEKLEQETGTILGGSPTQKVQGRVLEYLPKIQHSKPMLSAAKTKSEDDVKAFVDQHEFYGSYKLDGLTLVVRYEKGRFVQAITRGNGIIGEDVTEHARLIRNLPMVLKDQIDLEVRGECVVSWDNFNYINQMLEEPFAHPRNLAAGTLRGLDTDITRIRGLSFVVFEVVAGIDKDSKLQQLEQLDLMGFTTVDRMKGDVTDIIQYMTPDESPYPTDGIVFEINSQAVSQALGSTAHHENCRLAFKWKDEIYNTTLRDVVWQTGKTGSVCPVAVFDPVDLDGAETTRATLHNLSMFESFELGAGDTIQVYRANMVIPEVYDNLTRSNTLSVPKQCPSCGRPLTTRQSKNSKILICENEDCESRFIKKLVHFCGKDCMNVEDISEKALEKLIPFMSEKKFHCLYELIDHAEELPKIEGFGQAKVTKMLLNIDKSRRITLSNFLNALSIPGVGKTTAEAISNYFDGDWNELEKALTHDFDFTQIDLIGEKTNSDIREWLKTNLTEVLKLADYMEFQKLNVKSKKLRHLDFAITGSLHHYKNRKELENQIKLLGGRVNSTVTQQTNYLINNDKESGSAKNKRAKQYGVDIITEEEFITLITQL